MHWVFVAACGLSLVSESEGSSSLSSTGFSLWWLFCCGAWALGAWASVVSAQGLSSGDFQFLEHRLSGCGTWGFVALWPVESSPTRD